MVGELVVRGDELGVFEKGFDVVGARTDGEDGGEDEGELLSAHGLDFEGVVDGRDVEDGAGLTGENPCLLGEFDVGDSDAGNG